MNKASVSRAIVRPVLNSYNKCVRKNIESIDVELAKAQHNEYCKALQRLGLKLIWVEGNDSLPDSCFVEDTAVIIEEKAIICNMRVKSRTPEVVEVAKVLEKFKRVFYIKRPAMVDGGDILKVEERLFIGLSARTNAHAITQMKEILKDSNLSIVPVKVSNVLHLKSACTYLGNGYVILSKGNFDTDLLSDLKKVTVLKGEEYAADCLAINGTVLMVRGFPKTKKLIEKEGFQVEELEMSEFRKGEGALTCLSIIW